MRRAAAPSGPSYGAVYFEPVPEAALILGVDLGARFLRGAVCDLAGETRARQDVELGGVDAEVALEAIADLHAALVASTGLDADLVDGVVVGVPGVVEASGKLALAENVPGLEGRPFGEELSDRLGLPVALENDVNLAALGEQWLGVAQGVDDFAFLSIGTGMGLGSSSAATCTAATTGQPERLTTPSLASGSTSTPRAPPCPSSPRGWRRGRQTTSSRLHTKGAPSSPAARSGDPLARAVVEEVARRIALHVAAVSAVSDIALAVLGGGLGVNGDLLLDPVREQLTGWLPYPPRVEVSSLGEAAILTGALAVGLRSALENVFANRAGVVTA